MSVTLDSIASCSLTAESQPVMMALAVLLAVIGVVLLASHEESAGGGLLIGGVVCFILYFMMRSSAMTISSNGGERIRVTVPNLEPELMLAFLAAVESAKLDAMWRLHVHHDGRPNDPAENVQAVPAVPQ